MENMRSIRVTGKGQINVKPDTTRITMSLEEVYREYDETIRKSTEATNQLKEVLGEFGFQRDDLKTLRFSVDPEYEQYEERKVYKHRLVGYKFEHTLKVEFESDNKRLGKILYALANCSLQPEFRISYTVKDPEASKNLLLGKAVEDAREKAEVLTKAAGVKLKDILSIDYSWGEIEFQAEPMDRMITMERCMACTDASYDIDIVPDDIDVSDTVTVIWQIQ